MAEDARLTSFRRTLAVAAAVAVVATGMAVYLDHATQRYAEAGQNGSDRMAVAATPSPPATTAARNWATPRSVRIDMTPTGSISRPDQPRFKNVIADPSAGMPQ